jgi:hypothetical protein
MSLQEKWTLERKRMVRNAAKRAVEAGHRDFNSIKEFVVDKHMVPYGCSAARFAACIIHMTREENIKQKVTEQP